MYIKFQDITRMKIKDEVFLLNRNTSSFSYSSKSGYSGSPKRHKLNFENLIQIVNARQKLQILCIVDNLIFLINTDLSFVKSWQLQVEKHEAE